MNPAAPRAPKNKPSLPRIHSYPFALALAAYMHACVCVCVCVYLMFITTQPPLVHGALRLAAGDCALVQKTEQSEQVEEMAPFALHRIALNVPRVHT